MATVVGVFDSREQAERCVREMRNKGFTENEISIVVRGQQNREGGAKGGRDTEAAAEMGDQNLADGTAWGGALGALGGLLAGAGALAIPGVGPIIAAGPLAAALTGAVGGGVVGGLMDLGVPEERGRQYEEEVKQGRVLAVVETDGDKADESAALIRQYNARSVETH